MDLAPENHFESLTASSGTVRETLRPDDFSRRPHFHIAGAQKSASSWLHELLGKHPHVFMPREETPFFEDPDYGAGELENLRRLFTPAPPGAVLGIKRPTDFTRPECPARIARDLPEIKIIAVLRNPVDRAVSALYHAMRVGLRRVDEPNKVLNALLTGTEPDKLGILSYGFYGESAARFFNCLPREQMLFLLNYNVRTNPEFAWRSVCSFLGIAEIAPEDLHAIVNKGAYSPRLLKLLNWLSRRRYIYNDDIGRLYIRSGVIGTLIDRGISAIEHGTENIFAALQKTKSAPAVDRETKARLLDFYARDIEKLEALTGLNVGHWKTLR
jgi:hypothetical protein